LRNRGAQGEI